MNSIKEVEHTLAAVVLRVLDLEPSLDTHVEF
jgi:hypothetical protein